MSSTVASAVPSRENMMSLPRLQRTKEVDKPNVSSSVSTVKSVSAYEECMRKMEAKVKDLGVSVGVDSLVSLVRYAMEIVERDIEDGGEKLRIVKLIIKTLIDNAPLGPEVRVICEALLNSGVVEQTIGLVIDATKGQLSVNGVKDRRCCFVRMCCCCFCRKKAASKQPENVKDVVQMTATNSVVKATNKM